MSDDMFDRYQEASALEPGRLQTLMLNRSVQAHWTGRGDTFWYRRDRQDHGHEYVLVDPENFTRRPLFDHTEVAVRLSQLLGADVDPQQLPIASYDSDSDGLARITLTDGRILVPTGAGELAVEQPRSDVLLSPDGKHELFCREHELWSRDVLTSEERALTTGGEPYFAWGTLPDYTCVHIPLKRQARVLPPVFTCFSPSGRIVVTVRLDERNVPEYPFVEQLPADQARPRLYPIRYVLDDEQHTGIAQLAFIDIATGQRVIVDTDDDLLAVLVSTGMDALSWSAEEDCIYLLAHATGESTASLVRIDVRTGERRAVITETDEPLYEPNTHLYSLPLIRVLPGSNEVIWFSQRDGWGHLYRYDLTSGSCMNAITTGNLVVSDILSVDEESRDVLFLAGCGDDGDNPYWRKLYRAALDGGRQKLLTPESLDHEIAAPAPQFFDLIFGTGSQSAISPSGRFVIDHMSTVSQPPEIVLRDTESGWVVGTLERTDVTALFDAGYQAPKSFRVTANDGHTDLWGILTLPTPTEDAEQVPVIDLMYAGFQMVNQPTCFLGGSDLNQESMGPAAAYAALGFATVIVDGRGTPGRDKLFRQWTHGHSDARRGLEDHVDAIRALAGQYPLDLGRVGVMGHSYGGYNSTRSMLLFPDFFAVGVSSAGVHVPEKMPRGSWAWHIGGDTPRDSESYQKLGNLHLVDQLRGKLLLLLGDLDENATPDHTLALVDALVRAGKRFDMLLWPGMDHYRTEFAYATMRKWDYFVEHLLGQSPPAQFTPA